MVFRSLQLTNLLFLVIVDGIYNSANTEDGSGFLLPLPEDNLLLELGEHELVVANEEGVRHVSQLL